MTRLPAPLLLCTSLQPAEDAAWLEALSSAMPDEGVVTLRGVYDRDAVEIAIVANPPPGALAALPALRWIYSLWAGVDRLLQSDIPAHVPLLRMVDPGMARAMAEAVAATVLSLHRDFHLYAKQQRRGEWRQRPLGLAADRAVTILGLGEMGRAAATLLATLGFTVRGWSKSSRDLPDIRTYAGTDGFVPALRGADILVNLLPLTAETRHILNRETFGHLAPEAVVVNFGRGGHLLEKDLLEMLEAKRLSHAVLDVFYQEPLPEGHPFWTHPDITILPHVTAPTNMASAAAIVAAAIAAYRHTGHIPDGVNRGRGY